MGQRRTGATFHLVLYRRGRAAGRVGYCLLGMLRVVVHRARVVTAGVMQDLLGVFLPHPGSDGGGGVMVRHHGSTLLAPCVVRAGGGRHGLGQGVRPVREGVGVACRRRCVGMVRVVGVHGGHMGGRS